MLLIFRMYFGNKLYFRYMSEVGMLTQRVTFFVVVFVVIQGILGCFLLRNIVSVFCNTEAIYMYKSCIYSTCLFC